MIPIKIKWILYSISLFFIAYSAWNILNTWHYKPIKRLNKNVNNLQNQLNETGRQLNICETNLSKQLLQGYIDGIGEHNETIDIDFDNDLTY